MEKLIIVGNGMAGVACLQEILKYSPKHAARFEVTVFGDETHANYNRILLSSVLSGEREADDITINGLDWYQENGIGLRLGELVIEVNRKHRTVTGHSGMVEEYDKLIFATGSRAWIPPIAGADKGNVFAFRTLDDTRAMLSRA
ncbi:MAG: FAD-dependent oxidoreductase, partial [Acidobacteriota bacterium]|nr:FAD-dependent oxidoreductase [Acidobacteriota bacterium]